MARLIDADALWDRTFICEDAADVRKEIEIAPTVDAVQVVRCKDCKHNEDCINRIQFWGRNPVLELSTTEYHPLSFCSYGEKREEASNGS